MSYALYFSWVVNTAKFFMFHIFDLTISQSHSKVDNNNNNNNEDNKPTPKKRTTKRNHFVSSRCSTCTGKGSLKPWTKSSYVVHTLFYCLEQAIIVFDDELDTNGNHKPINLYSQTEFVTKAKCLWLRL